MTRLWALLVRLLRPADPDQLSAGTGTLTRWKRNLSQHP